MFAGKDERGGEKAPVGGNEFGGVEAYVGDNELDDHDTFSSENGGGHFVSSSSNSMHILMFAPSLLKSFLRNSKKLVNDSLIM